MAALREVENQKAYFQTDRGPVKAVDGVSLHVEEQDIVAVAECKTIRPPLADQGGGHQVACIRA